MAFALAPSRAMAREELRFTEARVLPAIGLELRIMANSYEQPLPALEQFAYSVGSRTAGAERVAMFDPHAKWVAEQHAAEWHDPDGNELLVAVIRSPPPAPFSRAHVAPEEYARIRAPEVAPAVWTPDMLARWVSAFRSAVPDRADRPAVRPMRLLDLIEFSFSGADSNCLAYAFRLNPQATGQRDASPAWFYAGFRLGPGVDITRARRAVRTRYLQYLGAAAKPAGRSAPSGPGPTAPSATAPPSAEWKASRDQAAQSIANLEDWWFIESENYILLTNMKGGMRPTARRLLGDLETLRQAYARLVPARVPITAVSVIRIPAGAPDYKQYVGPALEWSSGAWMPSRKELVIRSLEAMTTQPLRDQLWSTTFHEGFHQYLHDALDQTDTAAWFNEGQAALFETADVRNRGVHLREDPVKVAILAAMLENRAPLLKPMLALDYQAFYGTNELERMQHYTLAWAFAYYLRKGVAAEQRSPYAGLMERYVENLWVSRDATNATGQVFDAVDMDALEKDFKNFWRSPARRKAAERT